MEAILAIVGMAGTLGLGITSVVLAIRCGGLKVDANKADTLRKTAEDKLKDVSKKADAYRKATEEQLALLQKELEYFEDHELDAIEAEPDRDKRIARRRGWVRGVLSKAPSPASDDSGNGVREDETPNPPS